MKPDEYVPYAILITVVSLITGITLGTAEHMGLLSSLKDLSSIALLLPTSFAAFVAYSGLKSWRQELRGKSEFTITMELLKSSLTLRDALHRARIPGFLPNELDVLELLETVPTPDYYSKSKHEQNRISALPYVNAWQNRSTPVANAMEELKSKSIEVEIILGNEGKVLSDSLLDNAWEFIHAVSNEISDLNSNGHSVPHKSSYIELLNWSKDFTQENFPPTDELSISINCSINKLKEFSRAYIDVK